MKENVIKHILEENKRLRDRITILDESCAKQSDKIASMEKDLWDNAHYTRRNNIELSGICDTIDDDELEESVVGILNTIGVNCTANDIEACHRLPHGRNSKRKHKRVTTRVVNRKLCEKSLISRKSLKDVDLSDVNPKLKDSKIFINDNLCPYYKGLFGKYRLLHLDGLIHSYWSWKGAIFYNLTERGKKIKVSHDQDLFNNFQNFDFVNRSVDFVNRSVDFVNRSVDFVNRSVDFVNRSVEVEVAENRSVEVEVPEIET